MDQSQKSRSKYACKECDKSYAQAQTLRNHVKTVHEGKRYDCDACEKSFMQPKSLKHHKKTVHEKITPDQEKNSQDALSHKKPLDDETNKTEDINQDENDQSEERDQDEKSIQDDSVQEFPCDMCKKKFKEMSILESHIEKEHLKNMSSSVSSSASNIQTDEEDESDQDNNDQDKAEKDENDESDREESDQDESDPDESDPGNISEDEPRDLITKIKKEVKTEPEVLEQDIKNGIANQDESDQDESDEDESGQEEIDQDKSDLIEEVNQDEIDQGSNSGDESDQDKMEQDENDQSDDETDQEELNQDEIDQDKMKQDENDQSDDETDQEEPIQDEIDQDKMEQDENDQSGDETDQEESIQDEMDQNEPLQDEDDDIDQDENDQDKTDQDEYADLKTKTKVKTDQDKNDQDQIQSRIKIEQKGIIKAEEKIYKCDACDKTYNSYSGLSFHKKSKHKGMRFSCNFCDKSYTQSPSLKRHMKNIHKGKTAEKPVRFGNGMKKESEQTDLVNSSQDEPDQLGDNLITKIKKEVNSELEPMEQDLKEGTANKDESDQDESNESNQDESDQDESGQSESDQDETKIKKEVKTEMEHDIQMSTAGDSNDDTDVSQAEKIPQVLDCDSCDRSFSSEQRLSQHQTTVHQKIEDDQAAPSSKKRKRKEIMDTVQEKSDSNSKNHFEDSDGSSETKKRKEDDEEKSQNLTNSFDNSINSTMNNSSAKEFPCKLCEKSYSQPHSLRQHVKNFHEKLKDYSCEHCDTHYTQSHSLRRHIKNAHPDKPVPDIIKKNTVPVHVPNGFSRGDWIHNKVSEQSFNNRQETKKSPVKEFSFTTEQIERLEAFFQRKKFINIFEIEKLATTGSYPEERVQQWFEKRRKEIGKLSNDTQKNL